MDTAKRYQQVQQEHRERFRALMYREYKIGNFMLNLHLAKKIISTSYRY